MFSSKLYLYCATLAVLVALAFGQFNVPKPLVKEFSTIESHLLKKVSTGDITENMREASALLNKESRKLIKNRSLIDAIKKFMKIDEIQSIINCVNGVGRDYLIGFDKSLGYEAAKMHITTVRRIDTIAQHYALRFVEFCWDQIDTIPNLETTFKQSDYDVIDRYLTTKVFSDDIEENLKEASKVLAKAPANSHLKEALEQFISLNGLISKDSCNYDGYRVVFKNELAIRGTSKNKIPLRRIDRVIKEVVAKHDLICQSEYRKNYNTLLGQVDESVVKTMRSLADKYLDKFIQDSKFFSLFGEKKAPEVEEQSTGDTEYDQWVGEHEVTAARATFQQLATDSDDLMKCKSFGDEKTKMVSSGLINECYERYLIAPCKTFIEKVGKEVFMPQFYAGEGGYAALPSSEDDSEALSYNHGRVVSLVCTRLIKNKRWIYKRLAQIEMKSAQF